MTTLLVTLFALVGALAEPSSQAMLAPARIELRDQFDGPQSLAFPGTNVVVLVIADRKGSSQVPGWVNALESRYAGRIDLRGLADLRGVPELLHGSVRRSLRRSFSHPVMLDWTGKFAAALGRSQKEVVVLVIARGGEIMARVDGPMREAEMKKVIVVIDAALQGSARRTGFSTEVKSNLAPGRFVINLRSASEAAE